MLASLEPLMFLREGCVPMNQAVRIALWSAIIMIAFIHVFTSRSLANTSVALPAISTLAD